MKATLHAVYLLVAVMLGPTLFAFLEILGAKPNLFLIYIVMAGFYADKYEAVWLGLIFGFVLDILVGVCVGLNGILYMFVCFLTVVFCENMIRRTNAIIVFFGVLVWTVILEGINGIFCGNGEFLYSLGIIGIEALYNGVLLLIIYSPLRRLFERLYDEKR